MTREQAIEATIGVVCSPGGMVRMAPGETASEVMARVRGNATKQVDTLAALGLLKFEEPPSLERALIDHLANHDLSMFLGEKMHITGGAAVSIVHHINAGGFKIVRAEH